eukprot:m.47360 g.47360  ORF g.47360 m.47360 type:complete len:426 (+) comp7325_c0_seq1:40-1317(+)
MHLEVEKIGGCAHYQRHCLLQAPCCEKSYSCRRCHDDDTTSLCDNLNRHTVRRITCCTCGLKQLIGEDCLRCGQRFGLYFCGICRLYDDNIKKEQYHCIGCGSCRLGGRHKFKHCDRCGACYSKKNFKSHGCVEAALDRNCPVCLENLKASTVELYAPRCGHILHKACHTNLLRRTMKCPICSRSYLSFSNKIEQRIEEYPLPPSYAQYRVKVMCQSCHRESETQFHPLGHKCTHCLSYNTTQLEEPISVEKVNQARASAQGQSSNPTTATTSMSPLLLAQQRARQKEGEALIAQEAAHRAAREVELAHAKLRELEMIESSLSMPNDDTPASNNEDVEEQPQQHVQNGSCEGENNSEHRKLVCVSNIEVSSENSLGLSSISKEYNDDEADADDDEADDDEADDADVVNGGDEIVESGHNNEESKV